MSLGKSGNTLPDIHPERRMQVAAFAVGQRMGAKRGTGPAMPAAT